MSELKISPDDLFSGALDVCVNDINTKLLNLRDETGPYFALLATDMALMNIANDYIFGQLIKRVSYDKYNGEVAVIRAYY